MYQNISNLKNSTYLLNQNLCYRQMPSNCQSHLKITMRIKNQKAQIIKKQIKVYTENDKNYDQKVILQIKYSRIEKQRENSQREYNLNLFFLNLFVRLLSIKLNLQEFQSLIIILKIILIHNKCMPPKTSVPSKSQPKAPEKKVWKAQEYVTLTIPLQEVKDIKMAFDIFDEDGSGTVDPQQLKQAFLALGFKGENKFVYQILSQLDEDQSGGISFEQFLKLATAKVSEKDSRADIQKIFKSFDINNAGRITLLELKKVAQDLGQDMTDDELQKMFIRADLDDDGFVTSDDFYNIMTHKVYWKNQ